MLVHLIFCILNTIQLYTVYVNSYLVDHSDYTKVSDCHTCLIQPSLRNNIAFIEHTNKKCILNQYFYLGVKTHLMI
jgi:hypothetical protein